ncbi:MAG: 3-oxoacyl-ACP reductase family protein [Candidatus Eisenbacteria bacterium]
MISLAGKVALVTGASRGIGRATALLLARTGSNVVINYYLDEASAIEVRLAAEKLGVRAAVVRANVAERPQVEAMVETALREYGRVDIVVNNAGIWKSTPIDTMTGKQLEETIAVNLLGVFHVVTAIVPHMKERKSGSIINVSSTAGQRGEPFHSAYAASKGGVISLTKSLAAELAPHNIRVNCVAPGWVATDMTDGVLRSEEAADVLKQIPMGRVALPEEIAGAVLFLASDLSTFVTGEILNVNGGAVLCG